MNTRRQSGFGLIIVLVALLIVALLMLRNRSAVESTVNLGEGPAAQKPEFILDHVKKEAAKMGEAPPLPDFNTPGN